MMAWNWLSDCDVLFTPCHQVMAGRLRRSLFACTELDLSDLPEPRTPDDHPDVGGVPLGPTSSACPPPRS